MALMLLGMAPIGEADPEFKKCIARSTLDNLSEVTARCLKEAKARSEAKEANLPPDVPSDELAKSVADDEASKYSLVYASENGTPLDRCVQAGVTAQAYLNAGMPRAYDRWKRAEEYDCRRYRQSAGGGK